MSAASAWSVSAGSAPSSPQVLRQRMVAGVHQRHAFAGEQTFMAFAIGCPSSASHPLGFEDPVTFCRTPTPIFGIEPVGDLPF
jgi:hypothetical protein